jgi:hypothetical protein
LIQVCLLSAPGSAILEGHSAYAFDDVMMVEPDGRVGPKALKIQKKQDFGHLKLQLRLGLAWQSSTSH